MKKTLEKLFLGQNLSSDETRLIFAEIIEGKLDSMQLSALLTAMKFKGETAAEIAGAAASLRDKATHFDRPTGLYADSCGTGGDQGGTINVSTISALLAAECGVPMVKHGNRSVTSKCGSADVLSKMGFNNELSPAKARELLDETNFTFLYAPSYHQGIRHAMPVRLSLGIRTVFNILGPLANPAAPPIQSLGVYDATLCLPMAETLKLLGTEKAMVVHGSGLDEIALHGTTKVCRLDNGVIENITLTASDFGLKERPLDAFKGGDPSLNAIILTNILKGKGKDAHNDLIAANTAPLLVMMGLSADLKSATDFALNTLASGKAFQRLDKILTLSNLEKAA